MTDVRRNRADRGAGRRTPGGIVLVLAAAAMVSLPAVGAAGTSQGQQSGTPIAAPIRPPSVSGTGEPPTIRMYVITALLAALVVGANLTPSKRGHQD